MQIMAYLTTFLVYRLRIFPHWMFRCSSYVVLVTVLFLTLAFLQIIHVVLLSRRDSSAARYSEDARWIQDDSNRLYDSMLAALHASQVMDARGEYRIVTNLVTARPNHAHPLIPAVDDITLVSQCSANHLHRLLDLSSTWQGPISVAVFSSEKYLSAVFEVVVKLFVCNAVLLGNVSLHLVIPLTLLHRAIIVRSAFSHGACVGLHSELERLGVTASNYAWIDTPFPNNLLRNVALDNSFTSHVFVIDIDMIPSSGLYSQFRSAARNLTVDFDDRERTILVVPAFEIQESVLVPNDKRGLVKLWYKKLVRPFYQELCWKCQRHTNYYVWRNISISSNLAVGFEVEWKDPWEPFYIASRNIPRYDERFKQYGFNRISQSCELYVSGYKFLVLNNAFLLHRGFKTAHGFHASKEDEQNRNRLIFRQFKEGLKLKHSNSTLRC